MFYNFLFSSQYNILHLPALPLHVQTVLKTFPWNTFRVIPLGRKPTFQRLYDEILGVWCVLHWTFSQMNPKRPMRKPVHRSTFYRFLRSITQLKISFQQLNGVTTSGNVFASRVNTFYNSVSQQLHWLYGLMIQAATPSYLSNISPRPRAIELLIIFFFNGAVLLPTWWRCERLGMFSYFTSCYAGKNSFILDG
jgi:hypothetical protein